MSVFWILLAVALYGLLHSFLASLAAKARIRGWFGEPGERVYRLAYNLIATLTLLPVLALPAILPDRVLYAIPFPWSLINLALQGLALIMLVVGLLQTGIWGFLGLRQLAGTGSEQPARLVDSGLYRYVRHPLYTAGLLLIWVNPLMTINLLALNVGLTAYILIGAVYEERKLLREFGPAYESYRRKTPQLIPRLTRSKPETPSAKNPL